MYVLGIILFAMTPLTNSEASAKKISGQHLPRMLAISSSLQAFQSSKNPAPWGNKTIMKTPTEAPEEWNSVEVKPLIRHLTLEEAIKTYESGQIEWENRPREGINCSILADYKVNYIVAAVETNLGWDIESIHIDPETLGVTVQNEDGDFDEDYGWELSDITFWKPMEFPQNAGK